MITALGFGQAMQVGGEFLAGGPGGAVNALQHRVALAAAPVGAADPLQREMAEPSGGRHMGPEAQIDETVAGTILANVDAGRIVAVAADHPALGGFRCQIAAGAGA